jgi:hypothetical protein
MYPGSDTGQQSGRERAGCRSYYEGVTSQPAKFIRFPGLCFVELGLGALATDPANGAVGDLPYSFMHHLREALLEVDPTGKQSKLVHRVHSLEFPYRMIKSGFYMGNGDRSGFLPDAVARGRCAAITTVGGVRPICGPSYRSR